MLVTGGTFDKEYNELDGSLEFRETHIQEMLALGRSTVPVAIRTIMLIDSLDMTDDDRSIIADHCKRSDERRIIITHGTDTMPETARYIAERISDKTIILTGAMVPYTFGSSDGLFNLGAALAYVQVAPLGVYVSMNGRLFPAASVRKDKVAGRFVAE
ncbi:MAG: asparaginase domain-containing protein [bacterium]|nr:asparaginase domain-containing protein [bacterium]